MSGVTDQAHVAAIEAEGNALSLPDSTYDMLQRTALQYPEKPALSFFLHATDFPYPEKWNYREFFEDVTRTANLFHALGANKDTVIAYILPNLPETHFVIWGGQASGIVAAINPLLESEAIVQLLHAVNARILVTLSSFEDGGLWRKLSPELGRVASLEHVVLVNLAERVMGRKRLPSRVQLSRDAGHVCWEGTSKTPANVQFHDFGLAMHGQPSDRLLSGRRIDPNDYSSFFCTGGTTGSPKIAMRRHRNEVTNAWSVSQMIGDGIGPGKNVFCGLPLFHVNGALVTGLLPFSKGSHVIMGTPDGYRGEGVLSQFWAIVEHHQIHLFSAVPTIYSALLEVPSEGHRLHSLQFGLCGAAPMPPELFRRFQEETGLAVLEGYGLTEATCVSSINPPRGDRRVGSVGLPIPGQAMKTVILGDDGTYQRDAADGEVGVLTVNGPNVFAGYLNEEHNRDLWLDLGDGERWLHTGDLASRDSDGYFWLKGRTRELIIRGGHNIDPATIEEPLYAHPAVALAAAVGRPDSHAGELPVAYVQLKQGAEVSESELLSYLASRIGERAAMPKAITVIETMPLTAVGKIYKPDLKRVETERALAAALTKAAVDVVAVIASMDYEKKTLAVTVRVREPAAEKEAARVLGLFAFPYQITTAK
ncbi:acyl-CoA synthetase [Dyella sp. Tek66A03]|uniref:acyl-CoA synthetase n=1 Tax=Dyella sp. Tek66A03 TaxID=3458298 RepID=UPI00403EF2DE